jgi:hypothetical protein
MPWLVSFLLSRHALRPEVDLNRIITVEGDIPEFVIPAIGVEKAETTVFHYGVHENLQIRDKSLLDYTS